MKILNKIDNIILEVKEKDRIEKLLGYPDRFEKIEEKIEEKKKKKSKKRLKKKKIISSQRKRINKKGEV